MKKCLYLLIALMAFAATTWAQNAYISSESDLTYQIANGADGNQLTVLSDFTISSVIECNKSIILDLNGHTITANGNIRVKSRVSGSSTIPNTLEIYDNSEEGDGAIIGRYLGGDGCAIYVESGNGLDIFSGTVTANRSSNHNGGVIYNAGTFIMYGGTVSNGNAANGGAVYNAGTMTLAGGSIKKCTASTNGGAIYNTGTLTINRGTIGGIDETDPDNPVSLGNTATNQGGGIYSTGTVNINGGSVSYNTAKDGGGIYNQDGTLNMTGGSVSGNSTTTSGGGGINLVGNSDMTMSGGSIANNHSVATNGAIYVGGSASLTMTGGSVTGNTATNNYAGIHVNGTLNMSGNPIVMGNLVTPTNGTETTSNVYLPSGKKITVNGAFTTGASVGVTCAGGNGTTFTSGYGTNSPDNLAVFSSDNTSFYVTIENNEAKLVSYNPDPVGNSVTYLDVWENNQLPDGSYPTATCSDFTNMSEVSTSNPELSNGWYVVDQNLTFNKRITISGTVNLILADNTRLTANKGILVPNGAVLHIWGQSTDQEYTGIINATANATNYSGIGGIDDAGTGAGELYFHGGQVSAIGGNNAAGIKGTSNFGEGVYSIYIYGGSVFGFGGDYGAGIGGCKENFCGGIKITGGAVLGKGGLYAAGIGSGYEGKMHHKNSGSYEAHPYGNDHTEIRITGGTVIGWGSTGAGIGGGMNGVHDPWGGDPAVVYIDGGKVIAWTQSAPRSDISAGTGMNMEGACAIGWGEHGPDGYDFVYIYDGAKVLATTTVDGTSTLQTAAEGRGNNWRRFKKMEIRPCDHPEHNNPISYTDNGSSLSVDCPYCYTKEPYTFQSAGNWNDGSNWLGNYPPHEGNNVAVKAAATIPSGCTANVGNIDMQEGGSLTIADGGQLLHTNAGVQATVQKSITGYTQAQSQGENKANGWYFIASPISTALEPSNVTNMLSGNYDLYRFNPTAEKEWENFKNQEGHPDFTLNNGAGYLYANNVQTTLGFTGELKPYSEADGANQVSLGAGWNLVGNPFACNVYASQPFYKMNETNTGMTAQLSVSTAIAPCEGIIVKTTGAGNVAFTKDAPQQSAHPGNIQIALAEASNTRGAATALDNAIVSFDEGSQLGKFYFGEQSANIYLPQGGEDYAIAYSDKQGEMPLNFKANENGTYTLTINPEGVEVGYLHLIDNMTGADVDLLANPSYSFNAKTTDYESRFKLVFAAADEADGESSEAFAFISDGNLIVNGTGTLQVIDMLGRQLSSQEIHSSFIIQHSAFPTGVYVLRLIDGDNVKVQKIVLK